MPNLKVKELDWYMKRDLEEFREEGYYKPLPETFKLLGRNGYYCRGLDVWFEYNSVGYAAYPSFTRQQARESFCYDLTVNDEAILPNKEAEALRMVLKTSRDGNLNKMIRSKLYTHESAVSIRETGRRARITATHFFRKIRKDKMTPS
jgi:hypothetical protein